MSKSKNCQSCGIPFEKDPNGGGTNADGSKSELYCSYCYQNGAFVKPDMTATEMQAYAQKKLEDYGIPSMIAAMLTKGIPKLKRWSGTTQ